MKLATCSRVAGRRTSSLYAGMIIERKIEESLDKEWNRSRFLDYWNPFEVVPLCTLFSHDQGFLAILGDHVQRFGHFKCPG